MSRSITTIAFGLCFVWGLALVQRASAEPKKLPAIGRAAGQVTSFDPATGMQTAVAWGRGSILGPHINHLTTYIDVATGQAFGYFEIAADHGSTTVGGSYTATFQPIDGTPWIKFLLVGEFEHGSGRLEGVLGEVMVIAFQNVLTGEVKYNYRGAFEFDE